MDKQALLQRLRGLRPLLPAACVVAAVGAALATSQPVLAEVPALLEPTAAAEAQTTQAQPLAAQAEPLDYPDGQYLGSAAGYGGAVQVRVTVSGGYILAVDVVEAAGETESFFNRARTLIDQIVAQNTWQVDAVTGATLSSNGIKNAVQNALQGGQKSAAAPGGSLPYADGVYTGSASGYGGEISVNVTVASGEIVAVDILEAEGETPSFLVNARAVIQTVLEQNTWQVDAVTGATYSSKGILNAIQNALDGGAVSTLAVQGSLDKADGAYLGSAEGYGGEIEVRVTVESGAIAAVDIVAAEQETLSYFLRARDVLEDVLEYNTWEVDTVTGATYSSRGILNAIDNALTGASQATAISRGSLSNADGEYLGSAEGYGGEVSVRVTVENGSIQGVDILSAEKETPSYFNKARRVLPDVLEYNTWKVDTVTGATYSSKGILNAIHNALSGASPTPTPTPAGDGPTYLDGVYLGSAEGFGGPITVRATVADGALFAIDLVSAEQETLSYLNRARAVLSAALQAQSSQVDAVTGATYSSRGILDALQAALDQAVIQPTPTPDPGPEESAVPEPSPSPTPAPEDTPAPESTPSPTATPEPEDSAAPAPTEPPQAAWPDGSYAGSAVCADSRGLFDYDVAVAFSVSGGQLGAITVTKGEDRSEYPEDNDAYLEKAAAGVTEQIVNGQSTDDVDAVSRATYSSNAIVEAVNNALAAGPKGEG